MVVMKLVNVRGVVDDRMEWLVYFEGFFLVGLKVLVVDDELLVFMIVECML